MKTPPTYPFMQLFAVTPEIENYSGSYFNQMGERIKGSTWLAADPGR